MAHDPDHTIPQHADRRRIIARPAAYPTLSPTLGELELLQRAARHIRLRPTDLDQVVAGGESSPGGAVPPARDPGS